MIAAKLITKVLQRYWRQTRGLLLEVRAVVRDAGGRVMLVRDGAGTHWRLPGRPVKAGETAEAALVNLLELECGITATRSPQIFAIYADHQEATTAQILVYLVQSWSRSIAPEKIAGTDELINLFDATELPSDVEERSRRCVGDVFARRQRSKLW